MSVTKPMLLFYVRFFLRDLSSIFDGGSFGLASAKESPILAATYMKMKRIMIVDDSKAILRVLTLGMERAGYEVVTACDGSDALLKIHEQQPDFLITDIEMPHVTGEELCLLIEKTFPDRTFPIVIMTSSTKLSHRQWAASIRNTTFIEKPVSVRILLSHVAHCFADADAATAAAPNC